MSYSFSIDLPGPLDVAASIERFRRWPDGIDRWDGEALVRTVPLPDGHVPYVASFTGSVAEPVARITVPNEALAGAVAPFITRMFVTVAREPWQHLLSIDPVIAALDVRYPGIRPVIEPDALTALVRSISAQQVNLTWAAVTRRRLAETFGETHQLEGHEVFSLSAARLAIVKPEEIRALQFTNSKSRSIIAVADALSSRALLPEEFENLTDEEVIGRLTSIWGIGRWSGEWFLARTLGRAVVAAGDLGVRKAVGAAYLGEKLPSEQDVRQATAHWGTAAGVAQQLLLHALGEGVDIASLSANC